MLFFYKQKVYFPKALISITLVFEPNNQIICLGKEYKKNTTRLFSL